jgi:hypothetical protein
VAEERLVEVIQGLINDALENVHTATIGRVEAVNSSTVDLRPVISRKVRGEKRNLPLLKDVPVLTLQGGSSYTQPPIAVGDYLLVCIMERCFDRWWDGQDFQIPVEDRMHDYSDAVALPGLNPLQSAIQIPDIWTEIGDRYQEGDWELQGDYTQTGNYTHTGQYDQDGDQYQAGYREQEGDQKVIGNVEVTLNVTVAGAVTAGSVAAGSFSGKGGNPMTSDVNFETTKKVIADSDVESGTISLINHTHTDAEGRETSTPN